MLLIYVVPFLGHRVLQAKDRIASVIFDCTSQSLPEVFDGVEIRRVRRKVKNLHAVGEKPVGHEFTLELLVVIMQQPPSL